MQDPQPQSVAEAVDFLLARLSLRSRCLLARVPEEELMGLLGSLGLFIRDQLLQPRNQALLESCREAANDKYLHWEQAPLIIIRALWHKLQATHALRATC